MAAEPGLWKHAETSNTTDYWLKTENIPCIFENAQWILLLIASFFALLLSQHRKQKLEKGWAIYTGKMCFLSWTEADLFASKQDLLLWLM